MSDVTSEFIKNCLSIEEKICHQYIDPSGYCDPIIDGIVNIEKYLQSKFKILWILKEPYDDFKDGKPEGGGWHFGKHFLGTDIPYKKFGRSATWQPMVYVTYGILNDFVLWDDMSYIRDKPEMSNILHEIAFMNVRKLPGYKRSYDYGSLWDAYSKNKDLLHLQIKTYNPEIIIFGSTIDYFQSDLEINQRKKHGSIRYAEQNNKLYIDAYHPGQTTVDRMSYVNDIIQVVKMWADKKLA